MRVAGMMHFYLEVPGLLWVIAFLRFDSPGNGEEYRCRQRQSDIALRADTTIAVREATLPTTGNDLSSLSTTPDEPDFVDKFSNQLKDLARIVQFLAVIHTFLDFLSQQIEGLRNSMLLHNVD